MVFVEENVLLFDGVCNLCNTAVNIVIDMDKKQKIKLASLQSDFGKKVLRNFGLSETEFDSLVFLQEGKMYKKSTAAFKVLQITGGFWSFLLIFKILPKGLNDIFYDFIARNRYTFFGKKDACRMPTPELKSRFIA